MSNFILSTGVYRQETLDALLNHADFRRATRNMCIAYLSMKSCVEAIGSDWQTVQENTGAVLGTSHGELSATANFLEELGKTNTARPLVFQSSLHNATLGFLTKQFDITGPTLTVSDSYKTGMEALEAAEILLSQNICKFCFVIGVDLVPTTISSQFFKMYTDGKIPSEGAATLLLANEAGLSLLKNTHPLGNLSNLPANKMFRYDSDYIENIAENLLKA